MGKIILISSALMFAAPANAGSRCERYPDNIARCLVPLAGAEASTIESKWRVAEDVLCCCKTFSGGECCARVAACAGKMPGCFCASRGVPEARPVTLPPRRAASAGR